LVISGQTTIPIPGKRPRGSKSRPICCGGLNSSEDDGVTEIAASDRAMRQHQPVAGELRGRVIAITGAGSGIGKALAVAAAALGADVILIGKNIKQLEAVHASIEQTTPHGQCLMAPLDLERALARDYDQLAAAVVQRYGRLDGLVHCAAQLGTPAPIDHYDVPTWCRVLHVNLTAAFALTQVLLPVLRASQDASIIFTSCSAGREPRAYWGAYAISKVAIEAFSRVLADENTRHAQLRCNTLDPGSARTTLRRAAFPSEDLTTTPEPATRVPAYLWLLSAHSRGVTGQALTA
jgi:NAD(P)-dependent dehydrogenase (short-subunit alcohol dehydrogenase family)